MQPKAFVMRSGSSPSSVSYANHFIITHIIPICIYSFDVSYWWYLGHYRVWQLYEDRHHKLFLIVFYAASIGLLCAQKFLTYSLIEYVLPIGRYVHQKQHWEVVKTMDWRIRSLPSWNPGFIRCDVCNLEFITKPLLSS